MKFTKILKFKVNNFRNLSTDILNFSNNINVIFGNNGNGKTNLLEAIYFSFLKKSFRKNNKFPQLLNINGDEVNIEFQSLLENESKEKIAYSGKIFNEESIWYLDNKAVKGKIKIFPLFINPFDFYIFHQLTQERRSFFDEKLGLIDTEYKKNLSKYTKLLRFRNKLLSDKPYDYLKQIKVIDNDFIYTSKLLTSKRITFLEDLKQHLNKTFKALFDSTDVLEINLDTKLNNIDIAEILEKNLDRDLKAGMTTYGIHKDDYTLLFNGFNSLEFCSLGQQKMSYLSLQFSFIELFKCNFGIFPIVLIDDISGELDKVRWRNLISFLDDKDFQTFLTTANEDFKKEIMENVKIENNLNSLTVNDGLILNS